MKFPREIEQMNIQNKIKHMNIENNNNEANVCFIGPVYF